MPRHVDNIQGEPVLGKLRLGYEHIHRWRRGQRSHFIATAISPSSSLQCSITISQGFILVCFAESVTPSGSLHPLRGYRGAWRPAARAELDRTSDRPTCDTRPVGRTFAVCGGVRAQTFVHTGGDFVLAKVKFRPNWIETSLPVILSLHAFVLRDATHSAKCTKSCKLQHREQTFRALTHWNARLTRWHGVCHMIGCQWPGRCGPATDPTVYMVTTDGPGHGRATIESGRSRHGHPQRSFTLTHKG